MLKLNAIIICSFCLIGIILGIITWFTIPYMKLNHLIVWINRSRQINHCDRISDFFQSLLCVTKSKHYLYLIEDFVLINTRNKISIDSIFSLRIYIALTVRINCVQDEKEIDEINEDFVVSFVYKNFKWMIVLIE